METRGFKSQIQATQTCKEIIINRTFDIPLDTLWKAWTDAETLKKWWAPLSYSYPQYKIDLKVDHKYIESIKDKKNGRTIWTGSYKDIIPEKKLIMTDSFVDSKLNSVMAKGIGAPGDWPRCLIVSVELTENNGMTNMTLKQGSIPAETADDFIKGWQQCFDKLEEEV